MGGESSGVKKANKAAGQASAGLQQAADARIAQGLPQAARCIGRRQARGGHTGAPGPPGQDHPGRKHPQGHRHACQARQNRGQQHADQGQGLAGTGDAPTLGLVGWVEVQIVDLEGF